MDLEKEFSEAYKGQVIRLFDAFFNTVLVAKDKEKEIAIGGEKFRASLDLLNRVLARAEQVAGK